MFLPKLILCAVIIFIFYVTVVRWCCFLYMVSSPFMLIMMKTEA